MQSIEWPRDWHRAKPYDTLFTIMKAALKKEPPSEVKTQSMAKSWAAMAAKRAAVAPIPEGLEPPYAQVQGCLGDRLIDNLISGMFDLADRIVEGREESGTPLVLGSEQLRRLAQSADRNERESRKGFDWLFDTFHDIHFTGQTIMALYKDGSYYALNIILKKYPKYKTTFQKAVLGLV